MHKKIILEHLTSHFNGGLILFLYFVRILPMSGEVYGDVFPLFLTVCWVVTGWDNHRCILLDADTGQDLATTRFCNPKMVPDRVLCVSTWLDDYLNKLR